ncbi:MAG: efflux RND transporter permease subunit [Candidatus Gracilibacteria bacterium]|nr:efflux RND transporter permease subunit [Candidatus Gracilibacteria bacterium]
MIVGIASAIIIPKESSPEIKIGIINIVVPYSGVNPVDMDSLITEKIEYEVKDIEGIKKMTSSSSLGTSLVTLELDAGADTTEVLIDVKDKVDNIQFPEDAGDITISEVSTNDTLLYNALIYGDPEKFDNFALTNIGKKIKSRLESVKGISSIDEKSTMQVENLVDELVEIMILK